MARVARRRSDSGIYHIMLRGINRQNIFEDDEDRYKLLEILRYFNSQGKYEIYSYCLMGNHVHLLLKEAEDTISEAVKRISSTYVLWYNKKYKRFGHLFQDRFKSEPVENMGYFLTVLRYIHQNPIKAKIVSNILETKWTSYYEYISEAYIVDIDLALDIFSLDRNEAIDLYMKYMEEDNKDQCLDLEGRAYIDDQEIISHLKSLGVPSISHLQQMDLASRNLVIKELKNMEGVPIRQISRVIGLSKSVVGRL
ncbi:MAG: transposase [Tissierellia bacterium]|nr:transposase [Tissierellia bacterium]